MTIHLFFVFFFFLSSQILNVICVFSLREDLYQRRERKKKVAVSEKNASKLKHFRHTIVVRFSCLKKFFAQKVTQTTNPQKKKVSSV